MYTYKLEKGTHAWAFVKINRETICCFMFDTIRYTSFSQREEYIEFLHGNTSRGGFFVTDYVMAEGFNIILTH